MKENQNLTNVLAQSAYVMNTIGGGISMAKATLNKFKDHYLYQLRVPGVHAESLKVEIDNSNLFIFQQMKMDQSFNLPYMISRINLPAEVDYQHISAAFEDGKLNVILPLNELSDGYHRDIDINNN
jgi:HSP20 family molecular chaperone IbpA